MLKCPITICALLATAVLASPPVTLIARESSKQDAAETYSRTFSETRAAATIAEVDRRFINKATSSINDEVQLARFVIDKAVTDDVKRFAEYLVDSHTGTNNELMRLAAAKDISFQMQIRASQSDALADSDAKQRTMAERLTRSSGKSFDREYLRQVIKSHKKILELFRREALSGSDSDVMMWAGKKLSLIADHLQKAQDVSKAIDDSKTD